VDGLRGRFPLLGRGTARAVPRPSHFPTAITPPAGRACPFGTPPSSLHYLAARHRSVRPLATPPPRRPVRPSPHHPPSRPLATPSVSPPIGPPPVGKSTIASTPRRPASPSPRRRPATLRPSPCTPVHPSLATSSTRRPIRSPPRRLATPSPVGSISPAPLGGVPPLRSPQRRPDRRHRSYSSPP